MTPLAKYVATVAAAVGISFSALMGTAELVMPHEGERLVAYKDPGNPRIATICYGETKDVQFGDVKTHEECERMLIERLPDYILPVKKLMPGLPENRLIAYSDAAYNMGVGVLTRRTVNKSTGKDITGTSIVDMEQAGNPRGACDRLLKFDYAGGKKFRGLTHRRQAEHSICVEGL